MIRVDWVLACAVVLFTGGLTVLTIAAWRFVDRRADRRRLAAAFAEKPRPTTVYTDAPAEPTPDPPACGVPTYDTERCGLLAGHADRRHISWPSGRPYPPDTEPGTEPLAWDPPPVPAARLNAVAGWVQVGDKTVHRSCNADRRDGRHDRVCRICQERLGMASAGGAT